MEFSPQELAEIESQLFEKGSPGWILAVPSNERPLQGLAGYLDWRFHGVLSHAIRDGIVNGTPGECTYMPAVLGGKTFHILCAGAGPSPALGKRGKLPRESVAALAKNLKTLKLSNMGISAKDCGFSGPSDAEKALSDVQLTVLA